MNTYIKAAGIMAATMLLNVACSKDDTENMSAESYNTTFKMTDAPIDNANVSGVFVTVANVKVDGVALDGFTKTTFDLAALVNGKTKTLGNLDLAAKSYSNLELELDFDLDASGNAPGSYVALANGEKDKIEAASNRIMISDAFEVFAEASNEVIIDFDLRKTIKEETSTSSNFEFVSMSELTSGIRTVNEKTSGEISGTVNDSQNTSDKIVVYAYKKGAFNAETETQGQGESQVTFANAVSSSVVSGLNNAYTISFLEEDDYELVFASYSESESGLSFNALLQAESTTGLNLGALSVTSAIQLSANVTITGIK